MDKLLGRADSDPGSMIPEREQVIVAADDVLNRRSNGAGNNLVVVRVARDRARHGLRIVYDRRKGHQVSTVLSDIIEPVSVFPARALVCQQRFDYFVHDLTGEVEIDCTDDNETEEFIGNSSGIVAA